MRLVAWNAACNTKRRSHEQDEEIATELGADIVILSETRGPAINCPGRVWTGAGNLGMSISVRGDYRIQPFQATPGLPRYLIPVKVRGPVSFLLLALWPVRQPWEGVDAYHPTLMETLRLFRKRIRSELTVLAGDLNSNPKVQAQRLTHTRFVEAASVLGLASAYHELGSYEHGREPESTFLRCSSDAHGAGFHIDYCFVSRQLLPGTQVQVGKREVWRPRSDHLPLIVDIPNRNFLPLASASRRSCSGCTPTASAG